MIPVLKLPFDFDTGSLERDLKCFVADDWTPHFNTQYYEGDWSGIALRVAADAHVDLYPDPTATHYVGTAMLERCPYVPLVIETFKCPLESVRFLRLGPRAEIREHRDFKLSIEDGVARVHIPIKTNPLVRFYLDDKLVTMLPGEAWYLNFNLPHRVTNDSDEERIHLVVDCIANDWLRGFFHAA